ncbi:MAG: MarR family winged helix-turn-helix transcriptional regulator [Gammaproteobacteria bacterium]
MQTTLTKDENDMENLTSCIDINATTVLLGLSIVNKAKQQLKQPLSAANLTMNQWLVLKILYLNHAVTPTNVAKTIDADPTTISRHLDSLETRGLIERKNDIDDRRVIQLQITEEGNQIAKQIYKRYSGILESLEASLTGNQLLIWKKVSELLCDDMAVKAT